MMFSVKKYVKFWVKKSKTQTKTPKLDPNPIHPKKPYNTQPKKTQKPKPI